MAAVLLLVTIVGIPSAFAREVPMSGARSQFVEGHCESSPARQCSPHAANADHAHLLRVGGADDAPQAAEQPECSDAIPGAKCPSLQEAVRQGGVVLLKKGEYHQCAVISRPTVIYGNGARIRGATCQGKAAFVTNADTTIHNLHCEHHRVRAGNGACVRQQEGKLTLNRVTIRGSQNGVLAGRDAGDLTIRSSRILGVGGDCSVKCGRAHGIYYGGQGRLMIIDSTFQLPRDQGHLVKTGASRSVIESSLLDESRGFGSRIIDAFNGGEVIVRNTILIGSADDANQTVLGYDYEARRDYPLNRILIEGGFVDCANGPLISGRNSLEDADRQIRTRQNACR